MAGPILQAELSKMLCNEICIYAGDSNNKEGQSSKGVIRLGAFDCSSKKANKEVCAAHRALDGLPFPHIKLIADGVVYDFSAPQTTATSLLQFAYEHAKLPFQQKKPKAKKAARAVFVVENDNKVKKCGKKEGFTTKKRA